MNKSFIKIVTIIYSVDIINDSACVVHAKGVAVNNDELQISRFNCVMLLMCIMFVCNYVPYDCVCLLIRCFVF